MRSIPLSQAKLPALIRKLEATQGQVTITKNGRAAAVLIGIADFESLKETAEIKADKKLMREIRDGLKKKNHRIYTLDELFGEQK